MNNIEEYARLSELCDEYVAAIDALKEDVYGYSNSLDDIVPHYVGLVDEPLHPQHYEEIEDFVSEIIKIYLSFDSSVSTFFSRPVSDEEIAFMRNYLTGIIGFLLFLCGKKDYTYLGIMKILNLFATDEDESREETVENTVFWYLYDNEKDNYLPPEFKKCFTAVFKQYKERDFYYFSNGLKRCIRYYLFEKKKDYISNPNMFEKTIDLIERIRCELKNG